MLSGNSIIKTALELNPCQYAHQRQAADVHLLEARQIVTSLVGIDAAERSELENFVRRVFRHAYGAEIKYFMPQLMSLRNEQGDLLAVCGLRHASEGELFLERYLDAKIEEVLSRHAAINTVRRAVVEIGNLAVADPSSVRCLLSSVSVYLHGTSAQWAVFTGIPALRNSLTKLNMDLRILGDAKINALPEEERPDWGSYYEERPQVMAIQRMQQH